MDRLTCLNWISLALKTLSRKKGYPQYYGLSYAENYDTVCPCVQENLLQEVISAIADLMNGL